MTIKLLLLKSGEDIISDIKEMVIGEEEDRRIVGYFLNKPCLVKMRDPSLLTEESTEEQKKAAYQVSLYPWMPLSKDQVIPVAADWVVTIVEPIENFLKCTWRTCYLVEQKQTKILALLNNLDSNNSD
jgi:hypothetical protein